MGIAQKIFSLSQSSKSIILGVLLFGCSVLIWGMLPQMVLADEAGYALEFDDFTNLDFRETISLWIKPTGVNAPMTAPTSGAMILGVDRPRLFGITRAVYQDLDQIYVWNADSDGIAIVAVPFVLGEWLQVTMVHSSGVLSA